MRYLILFIIFLNLQAHNLKVFTKEGKDFFELKAYYSSSSVCKNCDVNITTKDNTIIKKKTNKNGIVNIPKDLKPTKIVVDGFLGHLKVVEFKDNFTSKSTFPFLLKMLFASIFLGLFFYILRIVKKR